MTTNGAVILCVDDEVPTLNLLNTILSRAGYKVLSAESAKEAQGIFHHEHIDLFILDVMMPCIDGFALCEWIRQRCSVPVIMLTARGGANNIVRGFRVGADDYITKPFIIKELRARVEAVLRRVDLLPEQSITIGDISVGVMSSKVLVRGQEIPMSPLHMGLLHYLMCHAGQTIDRITLFRGIWGRDPDGSSDLQSVAIAVHQLRERIEKNPAQPEYIITVQDIGYKFAEMFGDNHFAAPVGSSQSNVPDRAARVRIDALIQEDRLAEALGKLSEIDCYKQDAILLSQQLNRIQTQERQAIVTREYVSAERNRIAKAVLGLIGQ